MSGSENKLIKFYTGNFSFSKIVIVLLKGILIVLLFSIVYHEFSISDEKRDLLSHFKSCYGLEFIAWMSLTFLAMFFNWGIEAVKWRSLVNSFTDISVQHAMEAILAGVSLGLITPGRIGEFGGKLLHIPSESKAKALSSGIVNSLAQNIANVFLGILGILWFTFQFHFWPSSVVMALCGIATFALTVLLILYYKNEIILSGISLQNFPVWLNKYLTKVNFMISPEKEKLHSILALSFTRALVYCLQFVLLLHAFGGDVSISDGMFGVFVVFLLQSGLPLPPALSLFARAELAYFVFYPIGISGIILLAATTCLWIINLLIPALLGAAIILKTKITISDAV